MQQPASSHAAAPASHYRHRSNARLCLVKRKMNKSKQKATGKAQYGPKFASVHDFFGVVTTQDTFYTR
jgi:hypothetical protein